MVATVVPCMTWVITVGSMPAFLHTRSMPFSTPIDESWGVLGTLAEKKSPVCFIDQDEVGECAADVNPKTVAHTYPSKRMLANHLPTIRPQAIVRPVGTGNKIRLTLSADYLQPFAG